MHVIRADQQTVGSDFDRQLKQVRKRG